MSEFGDAHERKLFKGDPGDNIRRTIAIVSHETEFIVNRHDLHFTGESGLRDTNKPDAPISNCALTGTGSTPPMPLKDAIEYAENAFKRSVDDEQFTPLPAGADFPF
ncbi:MAG: hypothetical protein ABSG62_00215 [Terracidiphilus sp.]|jgi:hypothetical protein